MLWLFWGLAGWCGTPWRHFPPPPPGPDPWLTQRVLGIIGGLLGGWAFGKFFESNPMPGITAAYAASTCIGAVIVGRVVAELGTLGNRGR